MSKLISFKELSMLAVSMLLLASCDNAYLNQAKQLSQNAEKLQTVYSEQASDYIESCYRRANHKLILPREDNPFNKRKIALDDCNNKIHQEAKNAFIAENTVIARYLSAIANLAQDNNFVLLGEEEKTKLEKNINTQINSNSNDSNPISKIDAGKAFSALISFIYKQASQEYASEEIQAEVIQINPNFQKTICYFKTGWYKTYGQSLDDEEKEINTFYENTIRQVIQKSNQDFEQTVLNVQNLRQTLYQTSPDQGSLLVNYASYPEIYAYDRQWQNELDTLQQKKSILSKYIGVLNEIAASHAALEQASGGEGKGQETYCKGVDIASISNPIWDSNSHSQVNANQVNSNQINGHLNNFEKLIKEVEILQSSTKK